jgi:hypothetical protein
MLKKTALFICSSLVLTQLNGDEPPLIEQTNQIGRYQICATCPRQSASPQIFLLDTTNGTIWMNRIRSELFSYSFDGWEQLPLHPDADIPIKVLEPSNK